jgi:hypothetical protein
MAGMGRETSDEFYVIDLCDEVLNEVGRRQARFDWLRGDANPGGRAARLAVDAYWPDHGLVVEYRERQHDVPVPHFDKPDRMTVSGVHRGLQRKIYDQRRDKLIPAHGLRLVVIKPADLAADRRGRLLRHRDHDLQTIRSKLADPSTAS